MKKIQRADGSYYTPEELREQTAAALKLWGMQFEDKPKGIKKTSSEMLKVIQEYLPGIGYNIHWRDTEFEILPFSFWKDVFKSAFWTRDLLGYVLEVSDCEAFSLLFLAVSELLLKTNGDYSIGGICKWITSNGNENSSHRFNGICALDDENDNSIGIWLYEAMYNKYSKVEKGSTDIIIKEVFGLGQMTYIPTNVFE